MTVTGIRRQRSGSGDGTTGGLAGSGLSRLAADKQAQANARASAPAFAPERETGCLSCQAFEILSRAWQPRTVAVELRGSLAAVLNVPPA